MTGPDHYRLAEELLADRRILDDVLVGATQAHAMLALARCNRHGRRFRQPGRS